MTIADLSPALVSEILNCLNPKELGVASFVSPSLHQISLIDVRKLLKNIRRSSSMKKCDSSNRSNLDFPGEENNKIARMFESIGRIFPNFKVKIIHLMPKSFSYNSISSQ
ncbi:hypothetical protein QVD17_37260 [Tagetes erecta]|uniref:F-box domain-containing protein n=1 Tax=Tagetes erecta TaxID=13708 RepID=A0AAD8JW88_TARER|nr:hypothetical protein QVD17_37260 [Tagetes erecta]